MPSRSHSLDHVPAGMLSGRMAAGIAASTRLSAASLRRSPLVDADGMARLPAPGTGRVAAAVDRGSAGEGADPVALDPWLQGELQQRMERHRRELLPAYERLLRVQGSVVADAWLRREAIERGRREADALRGRDRPR